MEKDKRDASTICLFRVFYAIIHIWVGMSVYEYNIPLTRVLLFSWNYVISELKWTLFLWQLLSSSCDFFIPNKCCVLFSIVLISLVGLRIRLNKYILCIKSICRKIPNEREGNNKERFYSPAFGSLWPFHLVLFRSICVICLRLWRVHVYANESIEGILENRCDGRGRLSTLTFCLNLNKPPMVGQTIHRMQK